MFRFFLVRLIPQEKTPYMNKPFKRPCQKGRLQSATPASASEPSVPRDLLVTIPGVGTNTPSRTLKGEKTPPAAVRGEGEPPAVRIYFREIGQFGRITPEEEIRLAKRIQSGDAAARQEMILANLRFAVKIALDYEVIWACRASTCSTSLAASRPTASLAMRWACRAAMRPASLDSPVGAESSTQLGELVSGENAVVPDRELSDKNISGILRLLIGELPDRETRILTRRFGLDGEEVQTLEDIGHRFGITRERIRQLQNAALAKLRKMLDQLEVDPQ